jgi:hypothetical protein
MSNNDNDPRRAHRMSDRDIRETKWVHPYSVISFVVIVIVGLSVLHWLVSIGVLHPLPRYSLWPKVRRAAHTFRSGAAILRWWHRGRGISTVQFFFSGPDIRRSSCRGGLSAPVWQRVFPPGWGSRQPAAGPPGEGANTRAPAVRRRPRRGRDRVRSLLGCYFSQE